MNIFNLCHKKSAATIPPDVSPAPPDTIDSMAYLDGFHCVRCHAGLLDNRTDCLVCKMPYPPRVAEVANYHNKAKWRLVKVLDYDDAAELLQDTTEEIAKNPKLFPQQAFSRMLHYWKA